MRSQDQAPGSGARIRGQDQQPGSGARVRSQDQGSGSAARISSQDQQPGSGVRISSQDQQPVWRASTSTASCDGGSQLGPKSRSQCDGGVSPRVTRGTQRGGQDQETVRRWGSDSGPGDSATVRAGRTRIVGPRTGRQWRQWVNTVEFRATVCWHSLELGVSAASPRARRRSIERRATVRGHSLTFEPQRHLEIGAALEEPALLPARVVVL